MAFDNANANSHCRNSVIDLMCRHTSPALPPDLQDVGERKTYAFLTVPSRAEWKKCIPKVSSPELTPFSVLDLHCFIVLFFDLESDDDET